MTVVNTRTGERTTYRVSQQQVDPPRQEKLKVALGSKRWYSPEPSVGGQRPQIPLSDKHSRDGVLEMYVSPLAVIMPNLPATAVTSAEKTGSPFSKAITEEVTPSNFKVSKFNTYNPKSDL